MNTTEDWGYEHHKVTPGHSTLYLQIISLLSPQDSLSQVAHGNEDWQSLETTSLFSVTLLGNELFDEQQW